jgi:hypothetical protein
MRPWPDIDEPLLRERLAMDDARFGAMLLDFLGQLGPRAYAPEAYEQALGYPWARPPGSFVLDGAEVAELADLTPAERVAAVADHTGPASGRVPLLAIGSNAAPARLALKFGHLAGDDGRLLAVAGELHDFDVAPAAHPAIYGALPATLVPSPGTAVRTAVLWVTGRQLVQLTWSEVSYRFGRLDGIRFTPDDGLPALDSVFAYVSRFGAFAPDGEPVVLAAVPARGRTATARTQAELIGLAARLALGDGATDHDLLRALHDDALGFARDHGPAVRTAGVPFASPHWTAYPGSA